MDTIGKRLSYIIEIKGTNPNKIAVATKTHPSTIKNYMVDKGKPDSIKLDVIADHLEISRVWLKDGKGEIEVENNDDLFTATLINKLFASPLFIKKMKQLINTCNMLSDQEYEIELKSRLLDIKKEKKQK